MRIWFDYNLKSKKKNVYNQFRYTDKVLTSLANQSKYFKYDEFKHLESSYKSYKFLKLKLNKKSKILFIGSGWGQLEYIMSKKFDVIASDYNNFYVKINKIKNSKKFKYIKLDILSNKLHLKSKYHQIVINNIEYLFDNKQIEKCIANLKKLGRKKTNYFLIFRSRDSFFIKIIDNYLIYFEARIKQFLKFICGKRLYVTKDNHGYRRSKKEFLEILEKNNLKIKSIYEEMYETEYQRLFIVRKLGLSKLLSYLFLKSHPYLNIINFKT